MESLEWIKYVIKDLVLVYLKVLVFKKKKINLCSWLIELDQPTLNYPGQTSFVRFWWSLLLTKGRIFSQAGNEFVSSLAQTLWENNSKPRSYLGTSSFPAWLKIRLQVSFLAPSCLTFEFLSLSPE